VQRAIVAYFEVEPDNAFLLSELCERVYHGVNRIEKKHRVAVARAAKAIKTLDHMKRETLGGELVFYDPLNIMSYAMARLKSNFLNGDYRNHDPRRCPNPRQQRWNAMHHGYRTGTITEEEMETYETTFEIPARLKTQLDAVVENKMTEQDLRKMLAPGGNHHKCVIEGGAWWRHTEMRRALKRGDIETYNQLKKQGEAELVEILGPVGFLVAAQNAALENV